jgi:hypothetical protein
VGSVTSVFGEREDFEAALRGEGCLGLLVTGHAAERPRSCPIRGGVRMRAGEIMTLGVG